MAELAKQADADVLREKLFDLKEYLNHRTIDANNGKQFTDAELEKALFEKMENLEKNLEIPEDEPGELEYGIKDVHRAESLFFNNKFKEARILLKIRKNQTMYHYHGLTSLAFMDRVFR